MTAFYQRLLAASSLPSGTVWDLVTHPRTGGTGTTYDQVQTVLDDSTITSALQDSTIQASVSDDTITSSVSVIDATTTLPDSTITGATS
jgi:hypothetical protein